MCDYTAIVSKVKCNECAQECQCFECNLCKNNSPIIESCKFNTLTSMFDAITKEINKTENKSYGNSMGNKLIEVNKYLNEYCEVKVKLKLKVARVKGQRQTRGPGAGTLKVAIESISCLE